MGKRGLWAARTTMTLAVAALACSGRVGTGGGLTDGCPGWAARGSGGTGGNQTRPGTGGAAAVGGASSVGGVGGTVSSGCRSGNCSGCTACFETCVCQVGDVDPCVQACSVGTG